MVQSEHSTTGAEAVSVCVHVTVCFRPICVRVRGGRGGGRLAMSSEVELGQQPSGRQLAGCGFESRDEVLLAADRVYVKHKLGTTAMYGRRKEMAPLNDLLSLFCILFGIFFSHIMILSDLH